MESLDPVSLYFKEIRKATPLSHKEFLALWKKFKDGENALKRLTSKKKLSPKKKKELLSKSQEGEQAKWSLVKGNLRLVVPIAKRFYRPGLDFLDLIEEGNMGVIRAMRKFNSKKGFRFSTYASYWIEQSIRRFIEENSKTIRIPPHAWEALRKWFREWEQLTSKYGRNPTMTEMAEKLNLSARQVKGVLEAVEASKSIGSLDLTLDEDENLSLKDMVSDEKKHEPDRVFSILKLHDEMETALSQIPKREREVIEMRFGVDGGEILTLDEVGKKYKISRERVRQIQERGMIRLKQIAQKMGLG